MLRNQESVPFVRYFYTSFLFYALFPKRQATARKKTTLYFFLIWTFQANCAYVQFSSLLKSDSHYRADLLPIAWLTRAGVCSGS